MTGRDSIHNTRWREQAACVGHDARLFTDPRPSSPDTVLALAICRTCTVRQPCLAEALTYPGNADPGIRGGTTETDRQQLRRRRQAAHTPAPEPEPARTVEHGLFPTVDGDLTDITGRSRVIRLPDRDEWAVWIGLRLVLHADNLPAAWRHIADRLDELQPHRTAPLTLTDAGELAHPDGRTVITRLPAAPHLLVLVDGRPVRRAASIREACQHTTTTAVQPAGLHR